MISKKETESILSKVKDGMIANLELKKYKINFMVLHSRRKKTYDLGVRITDSKGCSFINRAKSADIIIFHDKHYTKKDLVATIFHELLHVRMACISDLVTLNMGKMHREEEKLVQIFERLFTSFIYNAIKKGRA